MPGTPPSDPLLFNSKRPTMTLGNAAVLALMDQYLVPGYEWNSRKAKSMTREHIRSAWERLCLEHWI